jgi:hypothetical protein
MESDSARTVASAVLATAGLAVAYVVLTTPPLRRFAFRAVKWWLGASVPVYLVQQTRRAWKESNPKTAEI